MTEFAGRTAVVTGGGSGMGRELVRQLVAEACDVAMCDVSPTGTNAFGEDVTPRPTWVIAPARKPVVSNRKPPIRNVQRTTTRRARDRSSNSATT